MGEEGPRPPTSTPPDLGPTAQELCGNEDEESLPLSFGARLINKYVASHATLVFFS